MPFCMYIDGVQFTRRRLCLERGRIGSTASKYIWRSYCGKAMPASAVARHGVPCTRCSLPFAGLSQLSSPVTSPASATTTALGWTPTAVAGAFQISQCLVVASAPTSKAIGLSLYSDGGSPAGNLQSILVLTAGQIAATGLTSVASPHSAYRSLTNFESVLGRLCISRDICEADT